MFYKIFVFSFSISFLVRMSSWFCSSTRFCHGLLGQNNPFLFKGVYFYTCHGNGMLIATDIISINKVKILTMEKLGRHRLFINRLLFLIICRECIVYFTPSTMLKKNILLWYHGVASLKYYKNICLFLWRLAFKGLLLSWKTSTIEQWYCLGCISWIFICVKLVWGWKEVQNLCWSLELFIIAVG